MLQRGKYLMVRVPTDHEYGLWKVALESQTADNVKATYVRPAPASIPNPKKVTIPAIVLQAVPKLLVFITQQIRFG